MNIFTHSLTVMGKVIEVNGQDGSFCLKSRSGKYHVFVKETTTFQVLKNLDRIDRDHVKEPTTPAGSLLQRMVDKYVRLDMLLTVQGIYQENGDRSLLEASQVILFHSKPGKYLFEDTHWWLSQITRLADQWLDSLFGDKRTYVLDDFAELYRTNLNIIGLHTDDTIQEMATLSRLIYGLSSAYLLTGSERYLLAAKAGVQFQRETFRMLSHDGSYCFWAFGKRKLLYGSELIETSLNGDDVGTIPLYEQIYSLAGLAQYYRITSDWEVLEDIKRTVKAFNSFYLDSKETNKDFPGLGGYFSHLDYVSMRPDDDSLGNNKSRKNWNSIGDHIPAYLVNLILSLDPEPTCDNHWNVGELLDECAKMLKTTSNLIVTRFPDKDPNIPYVNERFLFDWTPDHTWGWQRNRAIVGHNLKIAWNLARVARYYEYKAGKTPNEQERNENNAAAADMMKVAVTLADNMAKFGIDQVRGGCFDAVEREPKKMPIEFAWGNTKDFWQQEQGILAYLILYGHTKNPEYLELAREMMAFWNLYFLDRDHNGIFFRVTDDGMPVIQGSYGDKAGHSIAGYHAFELNYLAHIYIRTYVENGDNEFCIYFKPDVNCMHDTINIIPDFIGLDDLVVKSITVNGMSRKNVDPNGFQIEIKDGEKGASFAVVFASKKI